MAAVATRARFGPADHGRKVTLEEFDAGDFRRGFRYEIIDGRLYVSPEANFPEHVLERWLRSVLDEYAFRRPEVINFVATKGRVFLPDMGQGATVPEPDIAAYADVPLHLPTRQIRWQSLSPILVAEVLVDGEFDKDLTRNPALYHRLRTIGEYWVLVGSVNPDEPTLVQHVRRSRGWSITHHVFGSTLKTKLLPGLELVIDPRRPTR